MLDINTITILLNLPTIKVTKIEIEGNKIRLYCESIFEEQLCPSCKKKVKKVNNYSERIVRDMPLLGREVHLHIQVRQFYCEECNAYFNEKFEFISGKHPMTTRLEKYLYECTKQEVLERICARENVEWNVLQNIFNRYSEKELLDIEKMCPKMIGIDEFATAKGKGNYSVVIVNLENGLVLDILKERKKETLIEYFSNKGNEYCDKVEVFSCDMWEGFSNTAKVVFPNAEIVTDRFHFFKHFYEILDTERRELRKKSPEAKELKSIKWLLYKGVEKLSQEDAEQLSKTLSNFPTLAKLYTLKNELRAIFETHQDKPTAAIACENWLKEAYKAGYKPLNTFLKTFQNWKDSVLNFFTHRVSNGIVEGINNVIKMIKRQGFGYRNFGNFRAKIMLYFY